MLTLYLEYFKINLRMSESRLQQCSFMYGLGLVCLFMLFRDHISVDTYRKSVFLRILVLCSYLLVTLMLLECFCASWFYLSLLRYVGTCSLTG